MAGLQLSIRAENLDKVADAVAKLGGRKLRESYAKGLNDTGGKLQKQMRTSFESAFVGATSYVVKSPWVERATADKLTLAVRPQGGKNGVDPQKILQAQEFGGRRADKRFEVALKRLNLLPGGMQIALPADRYGGPYPGTHDGRGNFTGQFVRKLLAYLKTSSAAVNGLDRRKRTAALKKYSFSSNLKTRREIKLMDGKEWFVSDGRARLGAGIWVRGDGEFRCAVAFISAANYKTPRLIMDEVAKAADLQDYLDKRLRFHIRKAAGM